VVDIGRGAASVALALTDRILGVGAELMTVLIGAEAPAALGNLIKEHVRARSPLTEVCVYDVGQRRYPVIIGAE
jgi:dihydroxyacetone kinase-like predicted kinase